MNNLRQIKNLFFTGTSKDSIVLLSGTIVSNLVNFVIVFILAKSLTTADLGLIFTGLVFIQLTTDLFELGLNSAILTKLPLSAGIQKSQIISSSFILKVGVALIIAILVFFLAEPLSLSIFNNSQIEPLIKFSGIGILFLSLIFWGQSVFQSSKDFASSMILNTSINIFRLFIIIFLIYLGSVNVVDVFVSLQIVLVFSIVYLIWRIKNLISLRLVNRTLSVSLIKFGIPIGLGFAIAALYTKLDQILVFRLMGDTEAGIYGLSQRLATFFVFAVASFNSAIVPRLVSISSDKFNDYFKKTVLGSIGLSALTLIAGLIIATMIPLIFGENFNASVMPFVILILGMVFFILSIPFSSVILYKFKKNYYSFWLSLASLIIIFVLLQILIPQYQSSGAAISVTLVYLIQLLVNLFYYLFLTKDN